MSRFYDRVMLTGPRFPDVEIDNKTRADIEHVFGGMDNAVVVDATNIVRYFYEDCAKESWYFGEDIPNVAPPWEWAFFEARAPNKIQLEKGFINWPSDMPKAWGALVNAQDVKQAWGEEWEEKSSELVAQWLDTLEDAPNSPIINKSIETPPPRWVIQSFMFLEWQKNRPWGPMQREFLFVCEDGQPVRIGGGTALNFSLPYTQNEKYAMFIGREIPKMMLAFYLTMAFAQCKNVARVKTFPPHKASQKHKRRFGKPLVKYYTLQIDPFAATQSNHANGSVNGGNRSLHITRGHFATYSPGKPLFGKYVGTFWKPQHVRGSKGHGEIVKDYTVKAPK